MNQEAWISEDFLANPADLMGLLAQFAAPKPKPAVKLSPAPVVAKPGPVFVPSPKPIPAKRGGRCACGACQPCLDNARWDRIFNEKFADPTYYGKLTVRQCSTLADVR
jgi:hypothetical protein